ncbi:MAG: class I SAM-dependent methyltransferase [Clostridium sp.]|nr:class I SAM-dependent methyltransferase [Clostridium sp.]
MNESYWNKQLDFLKSIRTGWFNNDYIEFLIDKVWKIKKPVNIIDFGCGFGYIGLLFMPLLPKGSTYTGIDISENLLAEAKNIFSTLDYNSRFIKADLNEYFPDKKYDIAISQAVLRHIPNSKKILNKMIESVSDGGLVICMEGDLEIEKTSQYFSGLDYIGLDMPSLYRQKYRNEFMTGGRDYRIGIKLPIIMQELGLHDVDVRMNDRVKFINPKGNKETHDKELKAMIKAWGWDENLSDYEEKELFQSLLNKGLNKKDALNYIAGEKAIRSYIINNKDITYILQAPCIMISYGIK